MYFPNEDIYPNNCTVYIQVKWDDGSFTRGSGAMVGRNDILTAAHVVYDPDHTAVDIDVYPAYDGVEGPWGSFTSGAWQTNYYEVGNADNTISQEDSAWDLAVIGISDPMGDRTGWYGINSHEGSGTYEVMGYPAEQGTTLTADSGHVNFANGVYDISNIYHNFGSSGGPILNANDEVCGVVSSTLYGARIDDEWNTLLQWMSGNDTLIAYKMATAVTATGIAAEVGFGLFHALLIVGLTACKEPSSMARPGSESAPATGQSLGGAAEHSQPPGDELRRRCLDILQRISPIGQPLTPEDERLAGLIERPGQPTVAIAPLGRPHVTVDAHAIILAKRCY